MAQALFATTWRHPAGIAIAISVLVILLQFAIKTSISCGADGGGGHCHHLQASWSTISCQRGHGAWLGGGGAAAAVAAGARPTMPMPVAGPSRTRPWLVPSVHSSMTRWLIYAALRRPLCFPRATVVVHWILRTAA
jgi:hypothetical protein